MHNHPLIWLVLMALTLLSYNLTDASSLPWITAVILGVTALKGRLIIDGFMEMQGVSHIIRQAMHLYCPLLGAFIWIILSQ